MPAYASRSSARFSGGVDVTNTSQVLVTANPGRLRITIVNNSANDVSLKLRTHGTGSIPGLANPDPVAVANDGIVLKGNGGSWSEDAYTGPIAFIAGVAGPSRVAVTEI